MSRKVFIWLFVGLLGAAAVTAGGLYWASCAVPEFYAESPVKDLTPQERQQYAQAFVTQTKALVEEMQTSDSWSQEFSSVEINSWFVEDFDKPDSEWRPEGVSQPRVKLKQKTIQVGFQYDAPGWDGVISMDLVPTLRSPRELAIEIQSVRAGLMAVPVNSVIEQVADQIKPGQDWDLKWEQANGNPVAVLTYTGDASQAPTLESIEVKEGKLLISGRGMENDKQPVTN